MTEAAIELTDQSRAKVFISYSRKDMEFADRLESARRARGFEPLIDCTDIYAFEEWWKRVEVLISRADTVVFVLSPDAVRRESLARKEVAFAASLNKRFAPIVFRRVEDRRVPEELAKLNFIFFDDPARFERSAHHLAEALNCDIGWIRQHTDFGEQARRWTQAKGASGLLLRSPVLEQAERWIASRPSNAPLPTEETQVFIRRSRQSATRRRNILTGSLTAGLVLAVGLAGLAYWQRGVAVHQTQIAEERQLFAEQQRQIALEQRALAEQNEAQAKEQRDQALLAQSRFLADIATQRANEDAGTAVLLSLDALPDTRWKNERPYTAEAEAALFGAHQRLREATVLSGHTQKVSSASFSPGGTRVVTGSWDKTARIWDPTTGETVTILSGHTGNVVSAAFSPDGRRVVTAA